MMSIFRDIGNWHKKPYAPLLFWVLIGVGLLWGAPQLMRDPTQPATGERSPLVISEVMVLNQSGPVDEDGESSPWIEIHNRSDRSVNLANWSLTDTPDQPDRWLFPEMELAPDAYLLVFASGKDRRDAGAANDAGPFLHTDFRLTEESRFLALYEPTSRRYLDAMPVLLSSPSAALSLGYYESVQGGAYGYFDTPTPAAANPVTPTWQGMVAPVAFSQARGLYEQPIRVALSTATADAQIRYTTDGSLPSESNGFDYQEPLLIDETATLRVAAFKPGYLLAPVQTQTYLFPASVTTQPGDPPGWPDTWGIHRIDMGDARAGEPVAADYAMDPAITRDDEYGPTMDAGLRALPSVSIVTDMANLDIYFEDPQARGREAERPASVEFIYPDAPERNTQVDAGIRIQGGAGRWEFMPKHSFRLFFRGDYGATKLRHAVFPDSPVQEFETLVLRAGVDRSFAGHPSTEETPRDHRDTTYLRDEWARDSQIAISGVGSHGIFVHLYLNGLYWGLYNLVERPDAAFMASYYGGAEEDWFTASHGGAGDGLIDRFNVLLQLAEAGGLADPEHYATMLEFVDPIQFSDYVILNWYAGNVDWPENNWYVNVRYPAGRNLFFVWDAEDTWNEGALVHLGGDGFEGAPFPNVTKRVFLALMENADFRVLFADRLYHLLFHDGPLSDANAQARWNTLAAELAPAIVAESARWGDVRYEDPITPADWAAANERVLAQMAGNGEKLLAAVRAAGYYPPIDPPQFSQHGGEFARELRLTLDAPTGVIYYTVDGTDPRAAGSGEPAPSALIYAEPLLLTTATQVRARVRDEAGQWSALADAYFWRAGQGSDVQITEIMYNPPGGAGYEFIELQNRGAVDLDLSGAYFEGIDYRFPDHTTLRAGAYWTIVADFKQFRERYPTAEINGIFEGRLSDRGEMITLHDRRGAIIAQVTYDDANGWPLSADGVGDSLVWTGRGEPNDPRTWRASADLYGSPGAPDPAAEGR